MPNHRKVKITRIVLTGGHAATTAVSLIEELHRQASKNMVLDIYWIGVQTSIEGRKIPTLEKQVFPKLGVNFRPIIAGRLQRRLSPWTIPALAKIPVGFIMAFWELIKIKPKVILSFGGYAAFPVVIAGYLLRIPIIIHEQTVAAGRANKYSAYFANKITLARKESLKYFPNKKCVVIGNPIMRRILDIPKKTKPQIPYTLFVTGGSRGAVFINTLIGEILPKLLSKFKVIHQSGLLDFNKYSNLRSRLPSELRERYEVYDMIDPMQMDKYYRRADLIISRAGANTVAEIMCLKIPSILIPIPWSYEDEQNKNALFASQYGIVKVCHQDSLDATALYKEINFMANNWQYYSSKVKRKESPDIYASKKMAALLITFL